MTPARKASLFLLGLDIVAVLFVFNSVSYLRGLPMNGPLVITPLIGPMFALAFALYLIDGYNPRTDMISLDYTSLHSIAVANAMLAMLLMTFVVIPSGYELQSSRIVLALSYLALVPLTLSYRRLIYQRTENKRGTRSLVFIGDAASCLAFHEECRRVGATQPVVYSVVGDEAIPPAAEPGLFLQPFSGVLDDIDSGRLDIEALVLRETNKELMPGLSRKLVQLYFSGVPTYTLELFHQLYWRKIPLYRLNQTWLFQEGFQIAREPVFERLKRVADIFFALIGLALAGPIVALAAIAVWIGDRGPMFYSQNRVGKNHVNFRIHKLRTMRVHKGDGDLYTRPDDQRITPIGRFLRTTRIDEFPQLWNVLRGDMSMIGPRAEWDRLVENYEREIPCYHFRHLVKPGITGWAQVNYPYGASIDDTLRKLEYDLYYIRHFSFVLDASIVLKTIHVMLFGKGR